MSDDFCGERGAESLQALDMETQALTGPDVSGIGRRIRVARLARGMSMEGLAHLLGGMTRQAVASWESERRARPVVPDPKLWPEIARVLQVRYRWLVEGVGAMDGADDVAEPQQPGLEIEPLLDLVKSAARAGEYGLAAQSAEALAQRCREIEARQQPGARDKPDAPGKLTN